MIYHSYTEKCELNLLHSDVSHVIKPNDINMIRNKGIKADETNRMVEDEEGVETETDEEKVQPSIALRSPAEFLSLSGYLSMMASHLGHLVQHVELHPVHLE